MQALETVQGASGLSPVDRKQWGLEGEYAWSWAEEIWADMLA
jgi:Flavocytochrome c sulphide dehydrogenase, flavin-binding